MVSAESLQEDEDFEIVPQETEDHLPSWDVDDEDQDEVKRQLIQGMPSLSIWTEYR